MLFLFDGSEEGRLPACDDPSQKIRHHRTQGSLEEFRGNLHAVRLQCRDLSLHQLVKFELRESPFRRKPARCKAVQEVLPAVHQQPETLA